MAAAGGSAKRFSPRRRPGFGSVTPVADPFDALRYRLPLPTLAELFARDAGRAERYVVEAGALRIDCPTPPVDGELVAALVAHAVDAGVLDRRDAMCAGERINTTEDRAVLHTALRAPRGTVVEVDGHDVVPDVHAVLDQMAA